MSFDLNRLYSTLQNTGLQNSNNALYQVIRQLIATAITLNKEVVTLSIPSKTTIIQSILGGANLEDNFIDEPIIRNISASDVSIPLNGGTLATVILTDGSWSIGRTATSPLTGAGRVNITGPVGSGQTVLQIESGTTGATQGGFIALACNTSSVYNNGAQIGNVGGNLILTSNDGTEKLRIGTAASTFLSFGGQTTSFPALKRSSAILQVRLADDSAFAELDSLTHVLGSSGQVTLGADATTGILKDTGTAAGNAGINFFAGSPGSASTRNWGFITNNTAFGMIELMVSSTNSGSPFNTTIQSWTSSTTTLADALNIAVGTITGTKIGTVGGASGQKLGFFAATPIVQPLLATGAAHTVDDVITTLQNLGLCRQT